MPFYSRYTLLRLPPAKLRFRNGSVLLDMTWDCSDHLPRWIFRARRVAPRGRASGAASPSQPAATGKVSCDLPTVAPIQRAMAAQLAESSSLVIAASIYGRRHLVQTLRDGIVLAKGSPEARVMDALVKLGYAGRGRATARDL